MSTANTLVASRLAQAGIQLNGKNPWDVRVSNDAFYADLARRGSLAAGEDYVRGWWDSTNLEETLYRVLRSQPPRQSTWNLRAAWNRLNNTLWNRQQGVGASAVAREHYDQHPELFAQILGRRRIYSCAYWRDGDTLDAAQERKLQLISSKLALQPGDRVLDIGCGWGGVAEYIHEKHGCPVLGVTNSIAQAEYARARRRSADVHFECIDYRELQPPRFGPFDKIVSIGMFEHVGPRNYREYFRLARRLLHDDGLFLLQTIGRGVHDSTTEEWTSKYIFRNSFLPSVRHIADACDGQFIVEDWHNLRDHYVLTLRAWRDNLSRFAESTAARDLSPAAIRMWHYYLSSFIAAFRCGDINQCWQIVLSPRGRSRLGPRDVP
ncbi:MAG: cyclopropane fatty acyl phospholipid synthase [Phycisphaerae bacterium]|nr:cyclopropane fatty acyl phospholipid synthase [Phycisphaerae bacterium]